MLEDIIRRHPANPVLTADDIPRRGELGVQLRPRPPRGEDRGPAAGREARRAQSIRYAESADGLNFQVGDEVLLQPTAKPDNRNIGLFPEKIKGLYCRLDRPYGGPFGPQQRGASG